jgi:hypothetical protein
MVTAFLVLALIALGLVIAHIVRPSIPLWIGVVFLCIIEIIRNLPLGK